MREGHRNLLRHQGFGAVPDKVPPSTPVTTPRLGLANPAPFGLVQVRLGTFLLLVIVLVEGLSKELTASLCAKKAFSWERS